MAKAGQVVFSRMQRVVWGRPAAEVVSEEAGRLGAERVFLIVSRTLNRESDVVSVSRLQHRRGRYADPTRHHGDHGRAEMSRHRSARGIHARLRRTDPDRGSS